MVKKLMRIYIWILTKRVRKMKMVTYTTLINAMP